MRWVSVLPCREMEQTIEAQTVILATGVSTAKIHIREEQF